MCKCYLCGCEITKKNESKEHIIPNALGGRQKSKILLCKKCNNDTGRFEEELCKVLNFFISAFQVKRERGKIPVIKAITESGEKIYLKEGLKPERATKVDLHKGFIRAANDDNAKRALLGMKKKNPEINIDEIMNNREEREEYLNEGVVFDLSLNYDVMKAISKCIINFSLINNIEKEKLEQLIAFIKGTSTDNIVELYNGRSPYNHNNDIISVVSIIKSQKLKKIVCYLQFFNFYKFYVVLDDSYNGELQYNDYIFYSDGNIDDININVNYFEEDINVIWKTDKLKEDLSLVLNKIIGSSMRNEQKRLIKKCLSKLERKYPRETNPEITEDMIVTLSELIADKFIPFYKNIMIHNKNKT